MSSEVAATHRITVVLVDDDPLVRAGLRMILGGAPDIEVVGEAPDGVKAVDLVRRQSPDVVLMDIRMPHLDGLEATRLLLGDPVTAQNSAVRIIVLTTFDADGMVMQALRAGASGFLLKDTEPARLVEAVRTVAAGQPILSPSVTAQLIAHVVGEPVVDDRASGARTRLGELTEREREVALAIGRGLSNAEISRDLYLSVPTVKAHVSSVLAKLGADSRVQIAIVVHDADLP